MDVSLIHCSKVWVAGKNCGDNSCLWAFLFPRHSHIVALFYKVTSHNSNMWTFFFSTSTAASLSTQQYGTGHKAVFMDLLFWWLTIMWQFIPRWLSTSSKKKTLTKFHDVMELAVIL